MGTGSCALCTSAHHHPLWRSLKAMTSRAQAWAPESTWGYDEALPYLTAALPPLHQSPTSEGEEEELLLEEDEEDVLAGVSAEDKGRRPPGKVSEPGEGPERRGTVMPEAGFDVS